MVNKLVNIVNKIQLFRHKVIIGDHALINGFIRISNKGYISIEDGFVCNSGRKYNPIGGGDFTQLITSKEGRIIIGNNVGISNSSINSHYEIIIQDDVMIGGGCRIWDSNFHSIDYAERIGVKEEIIETGRIFIGKGCFIGGGTIILKGVTIGERVVVGAGSVVSKDIPSDSVYAGNPAVKIK
ncbi:MAG: acyltransferase [Sedimenticola sp.]